MGSIINYVKMHGLGNDFVMINQKDLQKNIDLSILAQKISSRHLGIGADQFIIYKEQDGYYDMLIYNQDGSKAKTCGNASRCLAKLIYLNSSKSKITLKITDRELKCEIISKDQIKVNMGKVSFDRPWMLNSQIIREFTSRYMIEPNDIICVEASNPHIVIFTNLPPQDQEIIGHKLQDKEFFADGVNVNFATIADDIIKLRVYERGTGFTLACGSGACASFAAAKKLGFVGELAIVKFELGLLEMSEENGDIIMIGPATLVSKGEYYYE